MHTCGICLVLLEYKMSLLLFLFCLEEHMKNSGFVNPDDIFDILYMVMCGNKDNIITYHHHISQEIST